MRKCCLDVVTRTLQTSVNVRKGFRYIFFTPDTSAQVNKFLSKWRVDPVKCPLRYCQKYSLPIIWGLVFLRWEGVVSLLQFQINVFLPGTRCYQQSWLLLSAVQKRREMRWWVWVLGSRASKEKLSSSAEVRELRRRSSALCGWRTTPQCCGLHRTDVCVCAGRWCWWPPRSGTEYSALFVQWVNLFYPLSKENGSFFVNLHNLQ